jgi:ribonuclease HI
MWISKHYSLLGNEEADNLAKEGTNKLPAEPPSFPLLWAKELVGVI